MRRNQMIINELENWMPTEEANANMMREIMERNRKSQQQQVGAPDKSDSRKVRNETGKGKPDGNTARSRNRWKSFFFAKTDIH